MDEPHEQSRPRDDLDPIDDIDVRTVSVIWSGDEPFVSFSGCSPFEAIGLLRVGLANLEAQYAIELEEGDDG